MAERRRRRSTECDSETEHGGEPILSEYDSTADDSRVTETETESDEYVTEEEETAEEDEGEDGGGDGKPAVDGERQSGDGEEQPKLDDDEDRQNPAYIPRRGAFYEHDMRLDPDEDVKEGGDQARDDKRGKGKLWKDESKWMHDKFDMYDQAPKSRQELVAMYGYDITQLDEPPEDAPKMGGRGRRGGDRDRKPQFQDFLPDSGKDRRSYGNRDSYENDYNDRAPRQSKSDTSYNNSRGSSRGRRARGGRSDGGQSRRNYSDFKEERSRGFSDRERDFRGQDQDDYGNNRDNNNRGRDNYGDRERGNFRRRERGSFGNDDQHENDRGYGNRGHRGHNDNQDERSYGNRGNRGHQDDRDYGNRGNRGHQVDRGYGNRGNRGHQDDRGYGNRGNRGHHDNQDDRGYGNRGNRGHFDNQDDNDARNNDFNDRPSNRGGFRGGRGRGRGEIRDNRRDNRRDNYSQQSENKSNRDNVNYDRQYSDSRDNDNYERQNSGGGRNRQNYERQSSGGRDGEGQFRKQNERSRSDPEPQQQDHPSNRYEAQTRAPPTRSYNKPTPKSYYTLSVTDDEKLTGDAEDGEYSPPAKGGISDLNVTVTGDRRSFKDRQRPQHQRSQDYVQSSGGGGGEDRREPSSPHGPAAQVKHQPTLPPRLQQQQQQQERKRQQKQQQQQQQPPGVSEKQDLSAQSRSNKRYSSQRQRPVPENVGFSEPQIAPIATSQIQPQFQQNFSPTKPGGVQPSVIVRPAISQQISAPPRQPSVGSPTMVIPGVPPPQSMIPVPGQVAQARPQRPPPPAGPAPVFAPGTMPSTVMPAVSVIGAPLINPAGMIYAAPPPAFQVPVPQFTPAPPAAAPPPQPQQPGETVRGGTTYYPQAPPGSTTTPGTTYYSPEMQMSKQNRVQVRRPKVPLPIVNPEDIKKNEGSEAATQDDDEDVEYLDESSEQIEYTDDIKQEPDDSYEDIEGYSEQPGDAETNIETNTEQLDNEIATSSEIIIKTELTEDDLEIGIDTTNVDVKSENISSEILSGNVSNVSQSSENVDRTETVSSEINESKNTEESVDTLEDSVDDKSGIVTADRPTELGIVVDESEQVDSTLDDSNDSIDRSSTFVVKTEVLTPTLSVSTSIKPEKSDEPGSSEEQPGDSSAIEPEQNEGNPELAKVENENAESSENVETSEIIETSTKSEKEDNESFEDAVESVE